MDRILVAGGAGFIGSHFVRSILAGEYPGFEQTRITVVDNLGYAANRGNLPETHPRLDFVKADTGNLDLMTLLLRGHDAVVHNALDAHPVLEASLRAGVSKVVCVSTDQVYGSIARGSWTEDSPPRPSSPYAASKAGGDLMALAYFRTHGLDVAITRCCQTYGPFQHRDKLVPRAIIRLLKNRTVGLYGDGSNVRDWVHVADHCRAIQTVLTSGRAGEVYHVAGGNPCTNKDLAERLADLCGASTDLIECVTDRNGHDSRYSLDDTKIREELGFSPSIPFDEGLASTVEWYKANYLGQVAYY